MTQREALNWEPIREFWRNNSGVNWDELEAAIKEALAQQDVQDEIDRGAKTLRETYLAQPEQKPVTWRNAAIRVGEDLCSVGPFGYYDMTAKEWLDWALSVVTVHAPPPQPEQCRKEQRGNGEYVCNCNSGECPELAQPEQEPVGEVSKAEFGDYPVICWRKGYVAKIGDQFYTTPPQMLAEIARLNDCIKGLEEDIEWLSHHLTDDDYKGIFNRAKLK